MVVVARSAAGLLLVGCTCEPLGEIISAADFLDGSAEADTALQALVDFDRWTGGDRVCLRDFKLDEIRQAHVVDGLLIGGQYRQRSRIVVDNSELQHDVYTTTLHELCHAFDDQHGDISLQNHDIFNGSVLDERVQAFYGNDAPQQHTEHFALLCDRGMNLLSGQHRLGGACPSTDPTPDVQFILDTVFAGAEEEPSVRSLSPHVVALDAIDALAGQPITGVAGAGRYALAVVNHNEAFVEVDLDTGAVVSTVVPPDDPPACTTSTPVMGEGWAQLLMWGCYHDQASFQYYDANNQALVNLNLPRWSYKFHPVSPVVSGSDLWVWDIYWTFEGGAERLLRIDLAAGDWESIPAPRRPDIQYESKHLIPQVDAQGEVYFKSGDRILRYDGEWHESIESPLDATLDRLIRVDDTVLFEDIEQRVRWVRWELRDTTDAVDTLRIGRYDERAETFDVSPDPCEPDPEGQPMWIDGALWLYNDGVLTRMAADD